MKTVGIKDLKKHTKESVDTAQKHKVVITRKGRPAAILIGVEGDDWETVVLKTSEPFWRVVQRRRKQKTVSLQEMRKSLE